MQDFQHTHGHEIDSNLKNAFRKWSIRYSFDNTSTDSPEFYGQNLIQASLTWKHLSIGLPPDSFAHYKEPQLFFSTRSIFPGRAVFIASSKLGKNLEEQADWFDALRTIMCRLPLDCFLISADKTTSDLYVRRAAHLFGIPVIRFVDRAGAKRVRSFKPQESFRQSHNLPLESTCFYLPFVSNRTPSITRPDQSSGSLPLHSNVDEFLACLADDVFVLSASPSGRTYKAILNRLTTTPQDSRPRTRILLNTELTNAKTRDSLIDAGATGWLLFERFKNTKVAPKPRLKEKSEIENTQIAANKIVTEPPAAENEFLLHWTRRSKGARPGQSQNEHLDDLVFQRPRSDPQPMSVLCQILASGSLIATNRLTRGKRRVVCFSDIPVMEIPKMTRFRPHLARWDFMPYGIGIRKSALQKLGVQPVKYGTEDDWKSMTELEKPFFQICNPNDDSIDWSIEKEWRIIGDLKLSQFSFDDAFVFVPTMEEAKFVSVFSRWPVVAVDSTPK